jgi:hypothetical protein
MAGDDPTVSTKFLAEVINGITHRVERRAVIDLAERNSSAAAAALSDKKPSQTKIAAAVGCSNWIFIMASPGWVGACPN